MIDPDKLRALAARLDAPSYWISGSSEGRDGENDAPREAAAAILAMAEREKRMREALEQIAGGKMAGWKSGEVAQQALGKDQA